MTPWTAAFQAPLSMGFSRQEYSSGLPCSSPGDLPNPEVEPASLMPPVLAAGSLPLMPPGKLPSPVAMGFIALRAKDTILQALCTLGDRCFVLLCFVLPS